MFALSESFRQCKFAYIEACENYQKQSYRNRCDFHAASGRQSLSVPVVHEGGTFELPIRDIRIDHSKPWVHQHSRAIVSAYKKAAFFDHYWDGLSAILESRPERLWDLNLAILRFILQQLNLPVELRFTEAFVKPSELASSSNPLSETSEAAVEKSDIRDLREVIHPKRPDGILASAGKEKPYFQVFAQKHGFIPNLSIMDLLFNEGPASISYLQ
ncbi:MAG: WbqC family protein [Bacteroidales bacterium]|nr:WbqC family protein [Bacteroidales bacterium]